MSLPATTHTGTAPLAGVDEISLPRNATLKFSYPNLDDPLYIHSGANSIKWSFLLNTQTTPTLGGEVVQVLSAAVGPITISGQTAGLRTNATGQLGPNQITGWKSYGGKDAFTPNHELQAIMAWFRKYMTIAGTDAGGVDPRNRSIRFTYAERGWDFWIQPTALSGFRYDKAIISPEWSITAEIVSNNGLDHFAGVTMSSFTDELLTTNAKLQGQIGLSHFANTTTETSNPNFGQTGDHGSSNPFLNPDLSGSALNAVRKMGDNFQGLVAAWSQGDFAHFGFGAMLDNNALPKDVNAVYEKLFGNTLLGSLAGGSGSNTSGSGTGSYTYKGSNAQDAAAVGVANAFINKGIPPLLGVAVAYHETGVRPDAYQGDYQSPPTVSGDGAIGMFQTFYHSLFNQGPGRGAGTPHAQEIKEAMAPLVLNQVPPRLYKVTDHYPAAHQSDDASGWHKSGRPGFLPNANDKLTDDQLAQWAFSAQGGSGYINETNLTSSSSCHPKFKSSLTHARKILGELTASDGSATGLRASVLAWAGKADSYGRISYNEKCDRNVENYKPGNYPPTIDCSAYVALIYCWGTSNNHKFGTNHGSFNGTNTSTIASTWKGNQVPSSQAKAGDLVVWQASASGSPLGGGDHTMILLQDFTGGGTKLSGIGGGVGPQVATFDGEDSYHVQRGSTAYFYSILP